MNKPSILFLIVALFIASVVSYAQNQPGAEVHIKKAVGSITLDGIIDEQDWKTADVAGNWYTNYPVDTQLAPLQTEVRFTFNDEFFYVSFVCYDDSTPDIINSLRRDFSYDLNDNVALSLGPYNDKINGFFFVITPAGVQMEGTIINGGNGDGDFSTFWDNKWYSKVVRYQDKWIAELAIPFKSFRYKSDISEWNISMDRWELKRNRKSSWIQTPIQFTTASFPYGGQLIWDDPVPPAKTNISFIPYVTASTSSDLQTNPAQQNSGLEAGFDAKIAVTPSLNLDLTFNPDFSQVEVDDQIINLTRFEFQFPERRQFFLENSDLFSQAGFPDARPFFSRRVGLARDSSGLFKQVPILYGARLSGSLTEKWRVNVLNMQTREDPSIGLPAQNYTVAAIQRNFWAQSSIALSYVNKQSFGVELGDTNTYFGNNIFREVQVGNRSELRPNTYNRVLSVDVEMLSKDAKWYHSSFIGKSFDDFNAKENFSGFFFGRYQTRKLNAYVGFNIIEEFFNAEAGFVPGIQVYPGLYTAFGNIAYQLFPKNESIIRMGPFVNIEHTYIPGGTNTDRNYTLGYTFEFNNASALDASFSSVYQRLTNSFNLLDPSRFTGFLVGEEYDWNTISIQFRSNPRKKLFYTISSSFGGFYNGENFNLSGELAYRYQPYGNVAMRFDFNDLRLPENYGQEQLFLIGPRIDLTFTDQIFLTTYVQYNNVLDNVNLNARLQWRYKPASDLFIVYTENYLPQDFGSKNRALVLKLTYWLNL
jgi:hypothetical protein